MILCYTKELHFLDIVGSLPFFCQPDRNSFYGRTLTKVVAIYNISDWNTIYLNFLLLEETNFTPPFPPTPRKKKSNPPLFFCQVTILFLTKSTKKQQILPWKTQKFVFILDSGMKIAIKIWSIFFKKRSHILLLFRTKNVLFFTTILSP